MEEIINQINKSGGGVNSHNIHRIPLGGDLVC